MSKYDVSILDPNSTEPAQNARSLSFFAKHDCVNIKQSVFTEIKELGLKEKRNVRLLVHKSPEDDVHEMIIFQHLHHFFPPKKHQAKMKSFFIIEGSLAIFIFDDLGNVVDRSVLKPGENMMYRIAPNYFHVDIPVSDYALHLEVTNGPFRGDQDSIFPDWAPELGNMEELKAFHNKLLGER